MKWLASGSLTILIILVFAQNCAAQVSAASIDSLLKKAFITDELLPMLIDSAIKNSPQVKGGISKESRVKANYQINRKALYNAISVRSAYGYGVNVSAVNVATINENYSMGKSEFYNIGVGLQLPLSQIINRKNILKAERSLVEEAVAEKEKSELFVKQELFRAYQDLKLMQKLLTISSKNKQSAEINYTLADKNFLNGQLTVDQVSIVTETYNKALVDFETKVIMFQTSFIELEMLSGTNLSNLIMKIK